MKTTAQNSGELLAMAGGYRSSIILMSAVQLGICDVLYDQVYSAPELAKILKTDIRALEILLNALVSLDFLEKEGGRYKNSQKSNDYLVEGKENYLGDLFKHDFHLIKRWIQLPEVIATGKPVPRNQNAWSSGQQRDFIMAMENLAKASARQLLKVLDLSTVRRFLDVGGGPGTFSIMFCQHYPEMHAVVFDLPEVTEIAKGQIKQSGLEDRVTAHRGDYNLDPLGNGYDMVFLSNIIHSIGEESIGNLFKKSFQALNPGGKIIVKDFISEENMVSPPHAAIFSVNMLIGTEEGRCYSRNEIEKWLSKNDFVSLEYLAITDQNRLVIGTKP